MKGHPPKENQVDYASSNALPNDVCTLYQVVLLGTQTRLTSRDREPADRSLTSACADNVRVNICGLFCTPRKKAEQKVILGAMYCIGKAGASQAGFKDWIGRARKQSKAEAFASVQKCRSCRPRRQFRPSDSRATQSRIGYGSHLVQLKIRSDTVERRLFGTSRAGFHQGRPARWSTRCANSFYVPYDQNRVRFWFGLVECRISSLVNMLVKGRQVL